MKFFVSKREIQEAWLKLSNVWSDNNQCEHHGNAGYVFEGEPIQEPREYWLAISDDSKVYRPIVGMTQYTFKVGECVGRVMDGSWIGWVVKEIVHVREIK